MVHADGLPTFEEFVKYIQQIEEDCTKSGMMAVEIGLTVHKDRVGFYEDMSARYADHFGCAYSYIDVYAKLYSVHAGEITVGIAFIPTKR